MNAPSAKSISLPEPTKTPLLYKIFVVVAMMILMGGTLTGVMTYMNVGYSQAFYMDWFNSFWLAAVTVMPAGFLVMALVTKRVEKLMPTVSEKLRNLVTGISMACIMESFMAFTTAGHNIGFANYSELLAGWLQGFLVALPVALTLMVIISLSVKPKIERFLKS